MRAFFLNSGGGGKVRPSASSASMVASDIVPPCAIAPARMWSQATVHATTAALPIVVRDGSGSADCRRRAGACDRARKYRAGACDRARKYRAGACDGAEKARLNRTDRLYAIAEVLRATAPRARTARDLAGRFE